MTFTYDIFENEEDALKARENPLLPDGIYDFVVMSSEFKVSAGGNPMIVLDQKTVYEGEEYFVRSNLVGTKKMSWYTKHFCESVGLKEAYLANTFNDRLAEGRRGRYLISTEAAKLKPAHLQKTGNDMWRAKNIVRDYVCESNEQSVLNEQAFYAPIPTKAQGGVPASTIKDDEIFF